MVDLSEILTDLNEESAELDRLVADLPEADWRRPTPAPGWTVAHQIAHLNSTDQAVIAAATDPDEFGRWLGAAAADPHGFVDAAAERALAEPPELLRRWRDGRAGLAAVLAMAPRDARLPWFGTSMSPASSATARLMETWAHGEDVAAALGQLRLPTRRLRHVVHLGVRTMAHGFLVHGRPAPDAPVFVQLTGPDGGTWAFGPADAENRVTGPALDFCLLVTQRGHRDDLGLEATGPVADEWLDVAQAFAGPPGAGRPPRPRPPAEATGSAQTAGEATR
jgi:uncharacterized protein (TIGR03084 family)